MAKNPHILIVDDEPSIRLTLETGLTLKGFRTTSASNGREAVSLIEKEKFDLVICDVVMQDGDGLWLVGKVREFDADLPIILMTAQGTVERAFDSFEIGASDFIAKPFEIGALAASVTRLLDARGQAKGISAADDQLPDEFSRSGMVGRSNAIVVVYKLVAFAARTGATVLITGESGTGKELVAHAIHDLSSRAGKGFVSVNCSGLTDTLLEAELFGYEKGAFTGANSTRAGLFEKANGGTIFLDELASTSPSFQASLLRVLQSGEIRRVGSTETRHVDVRVLGSSNEDLQALVKEGRFRADLYYRLSVLTIKLPPLRERIGDVPLLARHFLRKIIGPGPLPHLTREVSDVLNSYEFPGNVRELENALARAVALSTGNVITLECLPSAIVETGQTGDAAATGSDPLRDIAIDRPTMEELERRYLSLTLAETGGNRRRTAEKLQLDRRTVQRLIARYKLSAAADDDDENAEAAGSH